MDELPDLLPIRQVRMKLLALKENLLVPDDQMALFSSPVKCMQYEHCTVLCKSNASEVRRISWLFMAFERNFASNEISATFPRTFKAPIVLFFALVVKRSDTN